MLRVLRAEMTKTVGGIGLPIIVWLDSGDGLLVREMSQLIPNKDLEEMGNGRFDWSPPAGRTPANIGSHSAKGKVRAG